MSNRYRPASWLRKNEFAPQVFLFRNMESGQVLYSQLPTFTVSFDSTSQITKKDILT